MSRRRLQGSLDLRLTTETRWACCAAAWLALVAAGCEQRGTRPAKKSGAKSTETTTLPTAPIPATKKSAQTPANAPPAVKNAASKPPASIARTDEAPKPMPRNPTIVGDLPAIGNNPQPHPMWTESVTAWQLDLERAVARVVGEIHAVVKSRPTTVVWLIDRSASAAAMRHQLQRSFDRHYATLNELAVKLPVEDASGQPRLLTTIGTFGAEVDLEAVPPTHEFTTLSRGLGQISTDISGKEMTFAALQKAIEKHREQRLRAGRELIIVAVTDEAGNDDTLVDELVPVVRKLSIPIYVIGSPAPLGATTGRSPLDEQPASAGKPDPTIIRQGPESRRGEMVTLGVSERNTASTLLDSGFGPFALEWICRQSGGRFLALRMAGYSTSDDPTGGWPNNSLMRFDSTVMAKYAPDYVSAVAYEELLKSNKARAALVQAAKIAAVELPALNDRQFTFRNQVALKRELDKAQKTAARLEHDIAPFFEALSPGEADRANLTGPRWQASYDLAMGRVLIAKARVEGYNNMLAQLKGEKRFKNANSTRWILVPSESTEAGSVIQKMGERGKTYLKRVATEHRGTPWAMIADGESRAMFGWTWREE